MRWNLLTCFRCFCNLEFPGISFGDLLAFEHITSLFSCLCMSMLTPNSSGNTETWVLGMFSNCVRQGKYIWGLGNCCHFADDIFECIFFNENVRISLKISLKFVPNVRINNIPALVQIMAWCLPGPSHYLNQWWLNFGRLNASLSLSELLYCHSLI